MIEFTRTEQPYYPPDGPAWESIEPASVGWDPDTLEVALQFAGDHRSSGVVILHRGRIMAERYWDRSDDAETPLSPQAAVTFGDLQVGSDAAGRPIEDVASVQKSVIAVLACIAREKAHLDFDDPVVTYLGAGWSNAPPEAEQKIALRHLLSMSSGLDSQLNYRAPAGERWFYNTAAYQHLIGIVASAAHTDINKLTREWLTGPVGMRDSAWVRRPFVKPLRGNNVHGFATTPRDLARFGLLVQAGGSWADKGVIVNRACLAEALSPSQQHNPAYGYLWWLNGGERYMESSQNESYLPSQDVSFEGPLLPTAPPDLVAARGVFTRRLYVTPSLDLVVVRLGNKVPPAGQGTPLAFSNGLWSLLMAAAPTA